MQFTRDVCSALPNGSGEPAYSQSYAIVHTLSRGASFDAAYRLLETLKRGHDSHLQKVGQLDVQFEAHKKWLDEKLAAWTRYFSAQPGPAGFAEDKAIMKVREDLQREGKEPQIFASKGEYYSFLQNAGCFLIQRTHQATERRKLVPTTPIRDDFPRDEAGTGYLLGLQGELQNIVWPRLKGNTTYLESLMARAGIPVSLWQVKNMTPEMRKRWEADPSFTRYDEDKIFWGHSGGEGIAPDWLDSMRALERVWDEELL